MQHYQISKINTFEQVMWLKNSTFMGMGSTQLRQRPKPKQVVETDLIIHFAMTRSSNVSVDK